MTHLELLDIQSTWKTQPEKTRNAIMLLGQHLVTAKGINPKGQELVLEFGTFADNCNQEAIYSWLAEQLPNAKAASQQELMRSLDRLFEIKVDDLLERLRLSGQ